MPQIDIDAPRLLAHCFLFELDAVVEDLNFSNYARFMDDIDAGAKNISDAKKIIKSIDLTLQTRQLRLNSGKTRILTKQEAKRHFRTLENRLLKKLEGGIGKSDPAKAGELLSNRANRWNSRKAFDDGNGEKILKRIFTLAIRYYAYIERKIVYDAIRLRPNVRAAALRYLSHTGFSVRDIIAINKIILDGYVCDDAFYLEYGRALAVGRFVESPSMSSLIQSTIELIVSEEFYRLHTAFVLASRFCKFDYIFNLMGKYESNWRHDYHLGRLIGGLSPIARRDKQYKIFAQAVHASLNSEAISIMSFHFRIRTEPVPAQILNKFLKKDTSFPCGI